MYNNDYVCYCNHSVALRRLNRCISSVGCHLPLLLNHVCRCSDAHVLLLGRFLERASCDAGYQMSDAELELEVVSGVDERVDTAVGEHQRHGEVVEPVEEKDKNVGRKANISSKLKEVMALEVRKNERDKEDDSMKKWSNRLQRQMRIGKEYKL